MQKPAKRKSAGEETRGGGNKAPSLNKASLRVPLQNTLMPTKAISTNNTHIAPGQAQVGMVIPAPIFDQLQLSIWKGLHQQDIVRPAFEKYFGKPKLTGDGKMLWWPKLGIAMSSKEKWAFQLVRFPAKLELLDVLGTILKSFPEKPDGKAAAQLRSAEVAWDFPVGPNYFEAEERLCALASEAMLRNRRARLRVMEPLCFGLQKQPDCYECPFFHRCVRCRDGARNGSFTFYFRSLSKFFVENAEVCGDEDDYLLWMPSPAATFQGKIYAKQLFPKAPWVIRFEVTLLGQKLEAVLGKSLPSDLTLLPRRLAGLSFDDFWYFERFDWGAFMESARRSASYKGVPLAKLERMSLLLSRNCTYEGHVFTLWQKRAAKKVAGFLKSPPLKVKIGAGAFSAPLKIEQIFSPPEKNHMHT